MRGKIFVKNVLFCSWLCHLLVCPFYLVGDACAQSVAILLVFVSILACCSALGIFEKHMLALVDFIHALPTRGGVPNSCFQGEFCIKGRKLGEMHLFRGSLHSCIWELFTFVQGELAFMHLGALFRLIYSCALLPMVSSPFASP
jgi:hypothetical protein